MYSRLSEPNLEPELAPQSEPAGNTTQNSPEPDGNFAQVDEQGRLIMPPEVARRFGLVPGEQVLVEAGRDALKLHRPVHHVARIYVELTTRCNMDCPMCQRRTWTHGIGDMTPEVLQRLLAGISRIDPPPTIVLGGFGEPLIHPRAMDFIAQCRQLGSNVELITNGLLLDNKRLGRLMDLEVDRLWLSVDGVDESCYGHSRMAGGFEKLMDRLRDLTNYKYRFAIRHLNIGFVFVAMQDNISQFPKVLNLARLLNVDQLLISNLLPYTEDGLQRILYNRSTWKMNDHLMQVRVSRMDLDTDAMTTILQSMGESFMDMTDMADRAFRDPLDTCPFIKKGSLSVGWDGRICPCPPLLHTHNSYFQGVKRRNRECIFGSLEQADLADIWNDATYTAFRKRVMEFDFTPCISCASCEWAESNEDDCFGNPFPTCGGCLWAQGLIQCP